MRLFLRSFVPALVLLSGSFFAQAQVTPSPQPRSDYALYFNQELSRLMISGEGALSLDPSETFTSGNGCQITVQTDGLIMCFISSSCPQEAPRFPFCAATFSAPDGLQLPDVVDLRQIPSDASSLSVGARSSRQVLIYEMSKDH